MTAHVDRISYATRVQTAALFVALITAGSFVAIPLPGSPVPIVLQNLFVVLAGVVLRPRWAALTAAVYLLLGAAGLPVFAGATGGVAHFAGPTGGFLLSYPLVAAATGWLLGPPSSRTGAFRPRRLIVAVSVGFLLVYLVGVPWLAWTTGMSPVAALLAGMVPFLPGDALKAVAIVVLVRSVPTSVWRRFI
jgi:biotin transport system substrate-specific component